MNGHQPSQHALHTDELQNVPTANSQTQTRLVACSPICTT